MQGKGKGSLEFNKGHQELPGMNSLPSLCGSRVRGAGWVGGFDFLVVMRVEGPRLLF